MIAVNVRWLSRYRHPRCAGTPGWPARCGGRSPGRRPLLAGAAEAGDNLAVLPVLFHLMWRQVLEADLQLGAAELGDRGLAGGRCPVRPAVRAAQLRIGDRVWFSGMART